MRRLIVALVVLGGSVAAATTVRSITKQQTLRVAPPWELLIQ